MKKNGNDWKNDARRSEKRKKRFAFSVSIRKICFWQLRPGRKV